VCYHYIELTEPVWIGIIFCAGYLEIEISPDGTGRIFCAGDLGIEISPEGTGRIWGSWNRNTTSWNRKNILCW
jgi:hypothetical protein